MIKTIGNPGSGKTTWIISKVRELFFTNVLQSNNQTLVLTFSRFACNNFKQRVAEYNAQQFIDPFFVRTFHSVAGMINRNSCNFIQLAIVRAIENIQDTSIFTTVKFIFVDEAQDLTSQQFQLIDALKQQLGAQLVLVGDCNQNIFTFNGSDASILTNFKAENYIVLKDNYRSASSIVQIANAIMPDQTHGQMISCYAAPATTAATLFIGTQTQNIKKILEIIQQIPLEDRANTAIIGRVKVGKTFRSSCLIRNIGLQCIRNALENYGIPYIAHYDIGQYEMCDAAIKPEQGKINIFTIHGVKGLEFSTVLYIDFHFCDGNRVPEASQTRETANLQYVAITRARDRLFMFCNSDTPIAPAFHKIKNIIDVHVIGGKSNTSDEYKIHRKAPQKNTVTGILSNVLVQKLEQIEKLIEINEYSVPNWPECDLGGFEQFKIPVGCFLEAIVALNGNQMKGVQKKLFAQRQYFNIFLIYLQTFVKKHDAFHLLREDLCGLYAVLEPIVLKLTQHKLLCDDMKYHKSLRSPHFPLIGIADFQGAQNTLEIKFAGQIQFEGIIQLILYAMLGGCTPINRIFNTRTGQQIEISVKNWYDVAVCIANVCGFKFKNSVLCIDSTNIYDKSFGFEVARKDIHTELEIQQRIQQLYSDPSIVHAQY